MKRLFIICMVLLFCAGGFSQTVEVDAPDTTQSIYNVLRTATYDGQTYPLVELSEITVIGKMPRGVKFNYRRHARLVYNVRRVYPYALLVRNEVGRVNRLLETMPNKRDQNNFLQQYEKDIFKEYEDDMKKLTFSQGKILIKLIERETQNTSFDLIRQYRGKFSATFWQSIARIFGADLKANYDPAGEDYLIEQVITEIEAGRL
jgi:DNA helicase HerA-like ATPase